MWKLCFRAGAGKKIKKTIYASLTDLLDFFFSNQQNYCFDEEKKKDLSVSENTNQPDTYSSFLYEYVFHFLQVKTRAEDT